MIMFRLKTTFKSTAGYHWPSKAPKAVACLIHGIGEYAGRYDRVAQMFLQSGVAMVSMDLRGHGCSFGRRGHCAPRLDVLKDMDVLLEYAWEQYPRIPLFLYGHSLGGNLTLDYRVRGTLAGNPAGYIISSPWIGLCRSVPNPLYHTLKAAARIRPQGQISAGINPRTLGNPKFVLEGMGKELCHNWISLQTAVEGFEIGRALEMGTHRGNGKGLSKPLLLMHGGDDKVCNIENTRRFVARQASNCTYREWPGYFHEIHNGNANLAGDEVIHAMIRWINQVLAGSKDERIPSDCL